VRNREIEAGAKAIASDRMLPGGRRKKLSRLIEDHLAWFDAAEARGMTWDDMIAALFAAGVTRPDGGPLTVGTLSSAVWRRRNRTPVPPPTGRVDKPQRSRSAKTQSAPRERPGPLSSKKASGEGDVPAARAGKADQPLDETRPQGAGVLAFMRRAAKMRRLDGD
jgi:hypothetical protein